MAFTVRIEINRAEGPTHLCDQVQTFEGHPAPLLYAKAHEFLFQMSTTCPETGGYDKTDFTITFSDGETYTGRLDCKHYSCDDPDLNIVDHVRRHVAFCAGLYVPEHMTEAQRDMVLNRAGDDTLRKYRHFWDTYDVCTSADLPGYLIYR